MSDPTYYAAGSRPPAPGGRADATPAGHTLSRARLNREQTIASNVLFLTAVLLYLFIAVWGTDLPTFGFYFVCSLNVALLGLAYWTWKSAREWFPDTAGHRRRNARAAE